MAIARNLLNTPLTVDANGSLLISMQPVSGSGTTPKNAANTQVKTDSNSNLLVAIVGSAGTGTPLIVASARATGQTAAVASVATATVGAADASYLVSANVNVTVATSFSITVTCAYTDEGNNARTTNFMFASSASATTTTLGNAAGALAYSSYPMHIRAKSGTAITIATAGTFTTITYNVEGCIQQVA